jgi:hypothetical protein
MSRCVGESAPMSFTFDLSRAVSKPLPPESKSISIGEEAKGVTPSMALPFDYTPPWEAVPLMLNWALTGGTRDEAAPFAQSVRSAETVSRSLFYVMRVLLISYLLAIGHFLKYTVNFGKDIFALLVLVVWWLALLLLLFSQLNGRLRAHDSTFTADDIARRPEFQLPALFYNYQPFGLSNAIGYVGAFIVLFVLVGTNASWAILLYECAARMLELDPYRVGFALIWLAFLLSHVLTACSLSVSYGQLRAITNKVEPDLTPLEKLRMDFVNGYIFVVLTMLLPLSISFVLYAFS